MATILSLLSRQKYRNIKASKSPKPFTVCLGMIKFMEEEFS
jgi:hypothetical protein